MQPGQPLSDRGAEADSARAGDSGLSVRSKATGLRRVSARPPARERCGSDRGGRSRDRSGRAEQEPKVLFVLGRQEGERGQHPDRRDGSPRASSAVSEKPSRRAARCHATRSRAHQARSGANRRDPDQAELRKDLEIGVVSDDGVVDDAVEACQVHVVRRIPGFRDDEVPASDTDEGVSVELATAQHSKDRSGRSSTAAEKFVIRSPAACEAKKP